MKTWRWIVIVAALLGTGPAHAQWQSFDTSALPLVSRDALPEFGTYWVKDQNGFMAPLPCLPRGCKYAPVYQLDENTFVVDKTEQVLDLGGGEALLLSADSMTMDSISPPGDGEDPGDPQASEPIVDTRRNYEKFAGQAFSAIDTNYAGTYDPGLYAVCASFPPAGTNTALQIKPYGDGVVIRAVNFDYSSEAGDFALLVCDDVAKPTFKTVDFDGASDTQDGWLVQGTVPNWKVTSDMFFQITNITAQTVFFKAIPYSGPQIQLTGHSPYDVVGGNLTLTATITDLSGTTNHSFEVTVDGDEAYYSLSGNTISIDTRYSPADICSVWLNVGNRASVYNPTNVLAENAKLYFGGSAFIPLEFSNPVYMVFAGNNSSPEIGETYSLFSIDHAMQIDATITDPADGRMVAHYAGYVPYAAVVEIPWDFTNPDGTDYTNDTYVVSFSAYDPPTPGGPQASPSTPITPTNTIARTGVRTAGWNAITYEEEDPALSGGAYLNSEASKYVGGLSVFYETLYWTDWLSIPQYGTWDIGYLRDNPPGEFPYKLTSGTESWWANKVFQACTNFLVSDFSYYMGHGNGTEIGGGPRGSKFVMSYLDSLTAKGWVLGAPRPNYRMRKIALWACYTDSPYATTAGGTLPTWAEAFGIRDSRVQRSSMLGKNVGLVFGGELPAGGYSGTSGGTSVEVAASFDNLWVTGPTPWPGACDPTYAFSWCLNVTRGMNPEVDKGLPRWVGFPYLPYSGIYDSELVTNNITHIKR